MDGVCGAGVIRSPSAVVFRSQDWLMFDDDDDEMAGKGGLRRGALGICML